MGSSFFDTADAAVYAAKWPSKIEGTRYLSFRDQPQLIRKYVNGTKALDYGCGSGVSTNFLKRLGLTADGVDSCAEMIERAKRADPTGHYRVIRSGEIPAADQSYDLVFANCVLMYVATKAQMAQIFAEVRRVLRPDGCFIAVVHDETFYNQDWTTANTQFRENENASSGAPVTMLLKQANVLMHQFCWMMSDYVEVCERSDLAVVETVRPLGRDEDGFQWVREKEFAPFVVLVMKKKKIQSA